MGFLPRPQGRREPQVMALEGKSLLGALLAYSCSCGLFCGLPITADSQVGPTAHLCAVVTALVPPGKAAAWCRTSSPDSAEAEVVTWVF